METALLFGPRLGPGPSLNALSRSLSYAERLVNNGDFLELTRVIAYVSCVTGTAFGALFGLERIDEQLVVSAYAVHALDEEESAWKVNSELSRGLDLDHSARRMTSQLRVWSIISDSPADAVKSGLLEKVLGELPNQPLAELSYPLLIKG